MSTAGLILAAGESRRMGSPKALLGYRGETFVDRLVGLLAARCAPVIVVLGAAAGEIREAMRRPATVVFNPDYCTGQTGSMQCGLRAVPAEAEGVLFTLVDHPAVAGETIDKLCRAGLQPAMPAFQPAYPTVEAMPARMPAWPAANRLHGVLLRVPRYTGRRGHPIWISAALIPEFLALPSSGAARDVVRAHAAETAFIDVDDPGILADIDDPAAYRVLTGAGT